MLPRPHAAHPDHRARRVAATAVTMLLALAAAASLPGAARAAQPDDSAAGFGQVSAGYDHACVLLVSGILSCWGGNDLGESTPPPNTFRQVSATGYIHGCGILTNGNAACWGYNGDGQSSPPQGTFRQISAGKNHSCGIQADGTIACWGDGEDGRTTAPAGSFVQVSAGGSHTCAIAADHTLTCWGADDTDQLTAPEGTFRQLSAGDGHTCALGTDGSVSCWGADDDGQTEAPDGVFTQVSAGYSHSCALATDSSITCWGNDSSGESTPPPGSWVEVSAGYLETCALGTDAKVACWGNDDKYAKAIEKIKDPVGRWTLSSGASHSCAVASDGSVLCWGADDAGQGSAPAGPFTQISAADSQSCGLLEDGSITCWGAPVAEGASPPAGSFAQLTLGGSVDCALATDGTASCWGNDDAGQATPPEGSAFVQLSAGSSHVCGVRADGWIVCWGADGAGQTDAPDGTFIAVSAGDDHTCGLHTTGGITCWGADDAGQTVAPDGTFVAVTSGKAHSCAIASNGKAICWGADEAGQASPTNAAFTQISAGGANTCGVSAEGTLACWGANDVGQSAPPVPGAPVLALPIGPQEATEDEDFSFTFPDGTFTDPSRIQYTITNADGSPMNGWLHLDAGNRRLGGRPQDPDVGTLTVNLVATNEKKLSTVATFTVTVANTNDPPNAANVIPDVVANEDNAFTYAVPPDTFEDPDSDSGDTLSLMATRDDGTSLPSWLSFDAVSGTFSGTPLADDVTNVNVRVTATDLAGENTTDTFVIRVEHTNHPPVIGRALEDQRATQDQPFEYLFGPESFTDPDPGDDLVYSATLTDGSPLPDWLKVDSGNQALTGTPRDADVAQLSIILTASDRAGATASQSLSLEVANVNDAPRLGASIPDQSATQSQPFTFAVPADAFTDLDLAHGDHLTLSAAQADGTPLPAWLAFDPATGTLSGTPTDTYVGSLQVTLTATDGSGATATDSFTISVADANDPPVLVQPVADQVATEGLLFTFAAPADAFQDADADAGDTLTYSASRSDGTPLPTWLKFDPATLIFRGTPATEDVGPLEVLFTASDRVATTASDTFIIDVLAPHDDPTPPRVTVQPGKAMAGNGATPALIDWAPGKEIAAGNHHPIYHLALRRDVKGKPGPWKALPAVRAKTSLATALPSGRLQLRLQATPNGGKPGKWVMAPAFTLTLVPDADPAIEYGPGWAKDAHKGALNGSVHGTSSADATLTFTTPDAASIGLVMPVGEGHGIFSACADWDAATTLCRTIDTSKLAGKERVMVTVFAGLAPGPHILTLTVVSGQIDLDGIVVMGRPEVAAP